MASGLTAAFVDELFKIASEYRTVSGAKDRLRRDIPVVSLRGWVNPEKALHQVSRSIESSKGQVLGHATVAVRSRSLPHLEEIGFKPTRLAVPLPGEKGLLPISYRRGNVHAHQLGEFTLMHHDRVNPEGVLQAARHGVTEGLPATVKRIRGAGPAAVEYAENRAK